MGKGFTKPKPGIRDSEVTKIPDPETLKDSFCLLLKSMSMYPFTACEFVYSYPQLKQNFYNISYI
jgi:hypothetical protein